MASSRTQEQPLLDRVQHLELELNLLKSQLSDWQHLRTSCEQVSAGVRKLAPDFVKMFLYGCLQNFQIFMYVSACPDRCREMNRDQKKPAGVTSHHFKPFPLETGSLLEAESAVLT